MTLLNIKVCLIDRGISLNFDVFRLYSIIELKCIIGTEAIGGFISPKQGDRVVIIRSYLNEKEALDLNFNYFCKTSSVVIRWDTCQNELTSFS